MPAQSAKSPTCRLSILIAACALIATASSISSVAVADAGAASRLPHRAAVESAPAGEAGAVYVTNTTGTPQPSPNSGSTVRAYSRHCLRRASGPAWYP